jgi:hypothetical protein
MMGIRDTHINASPRHVFMIAARVWPFKAKLA